MEIKFRPLFAGEIECRVQRISEKGFSVLLYKTARTDMNLLDETVGCFGWQNRFEEIKGSLYCHIAIYDKDNDRWIEKSSNGVESATEAIKGESSDAMKRAGFMWGIGRELYTAPFIYIKNDGNLVTKDDRGRNVLASSVHLKVSKIEYKDGKITYLVISNGDSILKAFGTKGSGEDYSDSKKILKDHYEDSVTAPPALKEEDGKIAESYESVVNIPDELMIAKIRELAKENSDYTSWIAQFLKDTGNAGKRLETLEYNDIQTIYNRGVAW